jgi:hypothetical protein
MNYKDFFKKYGIHFIAIAVFVIVGMVYFSPQLNDFGIKQHDIKMHKGMSNEIVQHREVYDEEPLWTNSMFGGMPAVQVSVQHDGDYVNEIVRAFRRLIPLPLGAFLLHLISFYIMALLLRIKPIIAILGAFAFAFTSYEIIIIQAGHNAKSMAVAFLPVILGAFIYAYKTNWKWGAIFSAFFMSFELYANHLQVTYYMAFLLVCLGIYFFVEAVRSEKIKEFSYATMGLLAAYGLSLFINFGNITMTNEFSQYTIRGDNDLTVQPNGETLLSGKDGLDKDYITQWSYGKSESFTFISPYVIGSHSSQALGNTQFRDIADDLQENGDMTREQYEGAMGMTTYFGEQPIVAGPFYLGVVVIFLSLLALVFVKDRHIWIYVGVSILALLLSWGKNFMGLTDFFIDYVPMYSKFRTVTIVLVLVELCIPILAVLLLQKLYEQRESIVEKKKLFLITSGGFLLFLLIFKVAGASSFSSPKDQRVIDGQRAGIMNQLLKADPEVIKKNYNLDVRNKQQLDQFVEAQIQPVYKGIEGVKMVREEMYKSSTTRSIVFAIFSIGICALFFYTSISSTIIVGGLTILLLVDLVPVNLNYLGKYEDEKGNMYHWGDKAEKAYPIATIEGDHQIMDAELRENPDLAKSIKEGELLGVAKAAELEYDGAYKNRVIESYKFGALSRATNYRVFDLNDGWSGTRASYYHKSIGGYHGAKLRNFQNLIDFHLGTSNNSVLNMLNVKYILQRDGKMSTNASAMGNAWAVKRVEEHKTPNDEIRALGKEFKIENLGPGKIYINNKETNQVKTVFGQERLKYFIPGTDSLDVLLSNSILAGTEVIMVRDRNGKTELMLEEMLKMDTLESFEKLVKITGVNDFSPREEVVMLSSEADKLSAKEFTGEATVAMKSYRANKMEYTANVKGNQLIVFSEVYYKAGWKAYVDGKEQEILKVNYLLRGLELKEGKHNIEFVFDDPSFEKAKIYSSLGSIILLLILIGMVFMEVKSRKKKSIDTGE